MNLFGTTRLFRICGWLVLLMSVTSLHAAGLINSQPASLVAHPDDTVRFRVGAIAGSAFQWYRNGVQLDGATDSVLEIPDVSLSDDGTRFACRVHNGDRDTASNDAILNVVRHTRQLVTLTGSLGNAAGTQVGASGRVLVDLRVDLFAVPTGGQALYGERFWGADGHGVGVEGGQFTVRLGEGRIDSTSGKLHEVVAKNRNLFVQFTVGSGSASEALLPRLPFTAMPYAISGNASNLKGIVNPNTAGLVAPIGTLYVNTMDNSTWIRTARSWVLAN